MSVIFKFGHKNDVKTHKKKFLSMNKVLFGLKVQKKEH